jgi:hypothetical protein
MTDVNEQPECSICLEIIDKQNHGVFTSECNHLFHSYCIIQHIQHCMNEYNQITCPICRHTLLEMTYNNNGIETDEDPHDQTEYANVSNRYMKLLFFFLFSSWIFYWIWIFDKK